MKDRMKWSIDDYHALIKIGILANRPVELLEGDVVEKEAQTPAHYFITQFANAYLADLLKGRAVS